MTIEDLQRKLATLREAWVDLQCCGDCELGDPFIDKVWDAYITARIDAEMAVSEFLGELSGFYVLAQIKAVHVEEEK